MLWIIEKYNNLLMFPSSTVGVQLNTFLSWQSKLNIV